MFCIDGKFFTIGCEHYVYSLTIMFTHLNRYLGGIQMNHFALKCGNKMQGIFI